MQATSDIFLGRERVERLDGRRRDFSVRHLRDWKVVAVAEDMENERDHQVLVDAVDAGRLPTEAA